MKISLILSDFGLFLFPTCPVLFGHWLCGSKVGIYVKMSPSCFQGELRKKKTIKLFFLIYLLCYWSFDLFLLASWRRYLAGTLRLYVIN